MEPLTKLIPCSSFINLLQVPQQPQAAEPDSQVLVFSICVAAINALSEDEVEQRFQETKDAVTTPFTSGIQAILALPEVLQHPSDRLLPALVLYAVCSQPEVYSDMAMQLT